MTDGAPTILAPTEECLGGRLVSLDALRGLVVLAMIFVNNVPAGPAVPPTLRHSVWNGITFADTIFPAFVFIMGVSMAYSFSKTAGQPRGRVALRFLSRVVLLFALGVLANVLFARAVGIETVRIPGVLQRLALASLLAAPFTRSRTRWVLLAAGGFLAAHTAILLFVAPPGVVAGVTSTTVWPGSTIAAWLDRLLLGPGYGNGLDPENFLGALSSAGGALLGVATGRTLIRHCQQRRGLLPLLAGGALTFALGLAFTPVLPLNKRLWTATFVLVVSGAVAVLLAVMYYVIDRREHTRPASLAVPAGRNAIALFLGSELLDALLLWLRLPDGTRLYQGGAEWLQSGLGRLPGAVAFAAAHVAVWYAVAWALHVRRIYVRL